MKGTPGFIGERLKQGREARGLTAIALSELIDISRQAISLFELDNASPQPDTLHDIADKLNLPVSFFLLPMREHSSSAIFFRSMCAATKMDRGRGGSRMEWLSELIVPYLRQFVSFPKVNLPLLDIPENPAHLRDEDIEGLAMQARRAWGLHDGPISNLVRLLENNGILVTRLELDAPTLDAFSQYIITDNTPLIILGANKQSAVRSRFNAAHECGHLILHRHLNSDFLKNTTIFKLIEQQANHFASALLIPSNQFADNYTIPSLNAFLTLKSKWLVSIGMLIKRAFDLEFISEEHYRRLWINYNRRGWRKEEPLDNKIPIEKPVLLGRALRLIIENQLRTPEQISAEIPLSRKDIEELLYIPAGALAPSMPKLKLKNKIEKSDYKKALEEVERIINGF